MTASNEQVAEFLAKLAVKRHAHMDHPHLRFVFKRRHKSIYEIKNGGRVVTVLFSMFPTHGSFLSTFDRAMRGAWDMQRKASKSKVIHYNPIKEYEGK